MTGRCPGRRTSSPHRWPRGSAWTRPAPGPQDLQSADPPCTGRPRGVQCPGGFSRNTRDTLPVPGTGYRWRVDARCNSTCPSFLYTCTSLNCWEVVLMNRISHAARRDIPVLLARRLPLISGKRRPRACTGQGEARVPRNRPWLDGIPMFRSWEMTWCSLCGPGSGKPRHLPSVTGAGFCNPMSGLKNSRVRSIWTASPEPKLHHAG